MKSGKRSHPLCGWMSYSIAVSVAAAAPAAIAVVGGGIGSPVIVKLGIFLSTNMGMAYSH